LGGGSGVRFYALGPSFIRVWFKDGDGYEYDHVRPGRKHVDAMKRLAEEGRGLATYINQHVRANYARKL
jgi:murein tripeptide amidase MpaA